MKLNLAEAKAIVEADSVPAENREITAKWTGTYPCLCHGYWDITIGGEEVKLPKEVMNLLRMVFWWRLRMGGAVGVLQGWPDLRTVG